MADKKLNKLLNITFKSGDPDDYESIEAINNGSNLTTKEAIVYQQIKKAMSGDTYAAQFVSEYFDDSESGNAIVEAETTGEEREILIATRKKICAMLDKTQSAAAVAALTRRLMDVTEKITIIDKKEKELKRKDNPLNVVLLNSAKKRRRKSESAN